MEEILQRQKVADSCLSGWAISQYCLDLMPPDEKARADAHLQGCSRCTGLVRDETADMGAAVYEAVPAKLLAKAQTNRRRIGVWLWPTVTALSAGAAVLLFLAVPTDRPDSSIRLKGGDAIEGSVMRDGAVVIPRLPLDRLGELRDGDRLRLRVPDALGTWVLVQGWQETAWADYYKGSVPPDRWLPIGLTLDSRDETRMRVVACTNEQAFVDRVSEVLPQGCAMQVLNLRVVAR